MWIAAEKVPLFAALDKGSFVTPAQAGVQCLSWTFTPQVTLPESLKAQEWTPENALIELLRALREDGD